MENKINAFEKEVKDLYEKNKDLSKYIEEYNLNLNELSNDNGKLMRNIIKLLKLTIKKSRRKIIFKYEYKGTSSYVDGSYELGINKNGLGLIYSYNHNLECLSKCEHTFFNKLILQEDFKNLLLDYIKKDFNGEQYEIVKLCLDTSLKLKNDKILKIEHLELEKVRVELSETYPGNFDVNIKDMEYKGYSQQDINLFINDDAYEILDLRDIRKSLNAFDNKEKIIDYLEKYKSQIEELHKNIKTKLEEVDKFLSPYLALENL